MDGFRNVVAVDPEGECNAPGGAPEILYLEPKQLVVNEDYQRTITKAGMRQIRKMARAWDWCAFKAPNVARTDQADIFEVVDGQHTAIAAVTNGSIPFLPCLVMTAETLQQKANGFLGINRDRIALTKTAIFFAQLAAQDEAAITVFTALSQADCKLLEVPPQFQQWKIGDTLAVGTLLDIAKKRGEARLIMLLKLLREAQAQPVSSMSLKALDLALPLNLTDEVRNRMMVTLRSQGVGRLEMIAKKRTPPGKRSYETLADTLSDLSKLPYQRMGFIKRERLKT